jgi:hypothetical protein
MRGPLALLLEPESTTTEVLPLVKKILLLPLVLKVTQPGFIHGTKANREEKLLNLCSSFR